MSITFWMPQAPVQRVQPYPDEPDYWEVIPADPFVEINMGAGNANAILALIAPDCVDREYDPCGTWDQAKLAQVRSATIRALNTEIQTRALSPTVDIGGPGTGQCRVISFGRDRDYVTQRLENFLALTKVAMEHGFSVSFG
jgi:hypothetical protein